MSSFAFLFPGQGSQAVGMGRPLHESSRAARAVFEEADDALGFSLSRLCFEGPKEELTLTANTQPAILATSIAALRALQEQLPALRPVVALGHSLGEFSALVAAGALRLTDALRLVRLRGQAMQEATPPGTGGMAAVIGLDLATLEAICEREAHDEIVAPANENGGGQIVVAGHKGAVDRVVAAVKAEKGRAIPLQVSAPFHCPLMQPAADRLAAALDELEIHPLAFPVIANVDAEPNDDPGRVRELLVRQVTGRVRWEASMRRAAAFGLDEGLELGHGRVLADLVKRISGLTTQSGQALVVRAVGSPSDIDVLRGSYA